MIRSTYHSGLSAVELLVTLFIAVAFLAAGHQLYTAIVRDSGATRQKTRASAVAQEYLKIRSASAPSTCSSWTELNRHPINLDDDDTSSAHVTVTHSCPVSSISNLTKTQVTVSYNEGKSSVTHAVYTTK